MEAIGNLVLSCKTAEGIWIGDNIRVEVVECGQGRTRLMVQAPREIPVDRDEVRDRKRRERSNGVERTSNRPPNAPKRAA